ncbi:1734_t:CDS:2, partial [Acaulospora colombiana]
HTSYPNFCKFSRQYHSSKKVLGAAVIEPKNDPPVPFPKKRKKATERDLVLEVLSTVPSQREARSFIKRFTMPLNDPTPYSNISKPSTTPTPSQPERQESSIQQKAQFVDSLFASRFEHVALIKIQGPFTILDLRSVAKTLVHLQKLGLMSIAVIDNEEWKEMLNEGPSCFSELRERMMGDVANICEAIENVDGRAVPIYSGVFTLKNGPQKGNKKPQVSSHAPMADVGTQIDVSVSWLKSCLKLGQIPLILPIALDGLSIQRTISANAGMIELSRTLSDISNANLLNLKTPQTEPMKIVVINSEGGVPSEERRGSHVFINIQQEYEDIKQSYKSNPQWGITHPTGLENFEMIKTCLEKLPSTSSAIMVPACSPTGLISNLITDKPLFSSSLPLTAPTTRSTSTTVIRYGTPVLFHNSLDTVNISALRSLIERS